MVRTFVPLLLASAITLLSASLPAGHAVEPDLSQGKVWSVAAVREPLSNTLQPVLYRPERDRLYVRNPIYRPGIDKFEIRHPIYRPGLDRFQIHDLTYQPNTPMKSAIPLNQKQSGICSTSNIYERVSNARDAISSSVLPLEYKGGSVKCAQQKQRS